MVNMSLKRSMLLDLAIEAGQDIVDAFNCFRNYNIIVFNAKSLAAFLPRNIVRFVSVESNNTSLLVNAKRGAGALMFWIHKAVHQKMIDRSRAARLGYGLMRLNQVLKCMIKYRLACETLTANV